MKKEKRKLELNAETIKILSIRELDPKQLEQVGGASGMRPTCIPDTDFGCTYWPCAQETQ